MKLKELLGVISADQNVKVFIPTTGPELWKLIADGEVTEVVFDKDVEAVLDKEVYAVQIGYSNEGYEAIEVQVDR